MRLLLLAFWACLPLWLAAENKDLPNIPEANTASPAATTPQVVASLERLPLSGVVERTYLLGMGKNHVYDSYLSPLDYVGSTLGFTRIGERTMQRGQGRWSQMTYFDLNASQLHNPVGNATTWDGELQFNYGQHYHLMAQPKWNVALGGLLGAHLGGTYNTRNGNNPGQLRMALDLAVSAVAARQFALWKKRWTWRTQCDIPVIGTFFTPNYGQSYYEIFTLGHAHENIVFSHPFNAPSVRLLSTISIPFGTSSLTLGYKADIRQSTVHHLDRHAWHHTFLIGYTKTLQFLKR